jgi:hypothetical protein
MSDPGAYTFLPWLRRGIANTITVADGAPGAGARASIPVHLTLSGAAPDGTAAPPADIRRDVALFGPGDIVGFDSRTIVRQEPRPGVTDFEPNYLAAIEFYDEDLPWRYTPAAPDGATQRLRPWLALVVLAEGEFRDAHAPGARLPVIEAGDLSLFPPADQLWAWAHVHVNRDLGQSPADIVPADLEAVLGRFETAVADNPDLASSRLLCPRRLSPDTAYHAFLMPTFESGRLAGLGLDPATALSPTASAWSDGRAQGGLFVYYHRWRFRTGAVGDFEYLVRLLKPGHANSRVGQRDMDVQAPGADLPGAAPALGQVLRLGGALRAPRASLEPAEAAIAQRFENWDLPRPQPFQTALADFVNLGAAYRSGAVSDPDPLIAPPLYGQWHAEVDRLLDPAPSPSSSPDNWAHQLNLDPRFRVAANFGGDVVRQNQEGYMAAAWTQVGAVLEANRRIRQAQLARAAAERWHRRHLKPQLAAAPGALLTMLAPALPRVVVDELTVARRLAGSAVGATPVSPALRRITRPGAHAMRRLAREERAPPRLLERLARAEITAAPPKAAPAGALMLPALATRLERALAARGLRDRRALLGDEKRPRETVDRLPRDIRFTVGDRGEPPREPALSERDSADAVRFKDALRQAADLIEATVAVSREAVRPPLPLRDLAVSALAALDPMTTIPARTLAGLKLPDRLRPQVAERFKEVMAYPEIDLPMYKPLVDLSSELFLPNLNLVEPNSITLLETNQRFIEAYMVGLNHEFARELLWREYPTDQRGSYFRQFWDPTGVLPVSGETPESRRERLRDIPPLHLWPKASPLGAHDNREAAPGTEEEEVVLVVRGDLLKRYPTAVIYAQRAAWVPKPGGGIDPYAERVLVEPDPGETGLPPPTRIRTPLYEAKVAPDIYFFGFDLTAEAARGGSGDHDNDDAGWFFVIQERPGEARFGFDIAREGQLNVWNDLAWADVLPADKRFVPVDAAAPPHLLVEPLDAVAEKHRQWEDDRILRWGPNMQASEVAYITYQAPMQVAVHAREMLRG